MNLWLTRQAEETYTALPSEEHRKLARVLFVPLIDPGATEQDTTRRRMALSEFSLAEASQTRLLQEIADAFISEDEVAFLGTRAAARMRFVVNMIIVVLIVVSSLGVVSCVPTHQPPKSLDPTRVINLQDNNRPGSLRYAINHAPAGSTITFDTSLRGTILLTSGDLNIAKNLTLRGPGAGILSISSGKSGYIVHVIQGVTVTISGLTFKDSKTSTGFINNEGTLTLSNSSVSGNTSTGVIGGVGDDAGGIYNNGGTLTLSNSTVSDNISDSLVGSGGIDNENHGTVTLSNSTVSGNTASIGGGIDNLFGVLTITNSTVSGNTAHSGSGGGINNDNAGLTITNSTVSGNTATDSGGGIYTFEGVLTITNSTVSGNTAHNGDGGGIRSDGATLTFTNSTVSGNAAHSGDGGGIYIDPGMFGAMLTLTNSTVSGNTATGNGGGIAVLDNSESPPVSQPVPVMLLYCTVYSNTASVGGGIWGDILDKKSRLTIGASIIAGNNARTSPDILGPLTSLGYNLVGDRSGATFLGSPTQQSTDVLGVPLTNLGIDPVLRDNGGSAKPHTWTHALLPGSPAIDLIPPDVCMSFKVFNDQRGVKRPQGKGCDSGAYEYSQ